MDNIHFIFDDNGCCLSDLLTDYYIDKYREDNNIEQL